VPDSTITGDALAAPFTAVGRAWTRLVFLGNADDPTVPSSSHTLDDLDVVRFHRGSRSIERGASGAERMLTLAFPDGRMSSSHGRLIRHEERWLLDDPASKNGVVVNGALTRKAVLGDGAVLELGRSFFLFRRSRIDRCPAHLAGDVTAEQLPPWPPGMATFSPALARDFESLVQLAPAPVPILLLGETGTGKEVVARALHELSRRAGDFVAVNCGALPPSLVEGELFGHRKGAFSGAVGERRGLVRSADRGTLFLDEIGELPTAAQAALLRVLQEREVLPIGDDRPVAVELRLVAATLHDLTATLGDGRFRKDLYARLAGRVVQLPPLRDRREDLGLLVSALLRRLGGRGVRFTPTALRALVGYAWPLNVRELEQALASAVALAADGAIDLEHLPRAVTAPASAVASPVPGPEPDPDPDLELSPEELELRATLLALFAQHGGNVVAVAAALGKRRAQIYRWIKRFAIDLAAFRAGNRS